ncbi:hypothetical protein AXF42_Ash012138 [Apostasia shenzhenica]|uniref:Uncharacterized protein n=1 Tax=Apostasia shenzhenica TaxID=1088818 RepID=A0A2I0B427_9ASPA|nr:hypothetical protein AXF42_Ash012138 [Apostasia shenzhenica]
MVTLISCCNPPSLFFLQLTLRSGGSGKNHRPTSLRTSRSCLPAFLAAAVLLSSLAPPEETLANIPQTLSGDDGERSRIQRPRSRKAESCTAKCVTTCIRGGAGSPGEGPLNIRRK